MINTYKQAFRKNEDLDEGLYKEMLAKELILRDYLAIERTILTNEATFLAYIRTSLTLLAAGVTIFHLAKDENLQYFGVFISIFSVYIFLRGTFRSAKMKNKINKFLRNKNKAQAELVNSKKLNEDLK